ncbi:acetyl-CoA carboxylase, carboxyltransferase subunit beta [bacterium]|nr:acetyl-CoA carboxylase, carboxyltransferase subunit beta [bacterium]MBU0899202.1 acetyl-CoA carboxylase, carboxyltransferase subunit beta [bacterium]MBU1153103.1 acetyl-CoA carboxylase, carboxyltransferase subunit beta [bacterium]MBU2600311.1 acetyl-CoA carboxylase, carboxyltransferase subunit beta [bacterium]
MTWFRKPKYSIVTPSAMRAKIPDGLWERCSGCGELIFKKEWEVNLKVCSKCNYHFRLNSGERFEITVDKGTFEEDDGHLAPVDFLKFTDQKSYQERIKENQEKVNSKDAVITGCGCIEKVKTAIAILDFDFMGGSMGSVMGEKITRLIEKAINLRLPLLIISSSGGARMQEGIVSLFQMSKTVAALELFHQAKLFYISLLTHPTMGGVTASFASLGDIIIAEAKALIGFAGPRVIEQTIKQSLPPNFQQAEFLLEHGQIDMVVNRKALKTTLGKLLKFFS